VYYILLLIYINSVFCCKSNALFSIMYRKGEKIVRKRLHNLDHSCPKTKCDLKEKLVFLFVPEREELRQGYS